MADFLKEFSEYPCNVLPQDPFTPRQAPISFVADAPSFPIGKIANMASDIFEKLLKSREVCLGDKFTPDTCSAISKRICHIIKYPEPRSETIYKSLYPIYMAQELDRRMLYQISTRIAGNIRIIKDDKSIPKWDGDMDMWVPVDVISVKTFYCRVPAKEIQVFITGGYPAGGYLTQQLSNKFLQYMMREIGYGKYKKFDASEIYNLKFTTQIVRNKSKIRMMAFSANSSQKSRNRELFQMRHVVGPLGFPLECTLCPKGLSECPASLHKETYVIGDCANGHRGMLEPKAVQCIDCLEKQKRDEYFKRMEEYEQHGKEGRDEADQHGDISPSASEGREESGVLCAGSGHNNGNEAGSQHDSQTVQ